MPHLVPPLTKTYFCGSPFKFAVFFSFLGAKTFLARHFDAIWRSKLVNLRLLAMLLPCLSIMFFTISIPSISNVLHNMLLQHCLLLIVVVTYFKELVSFCYKPSWDLKFILAFSAWVFWILLFHSHAIIFSASESLCAISCTCFLCIYIKGLDTNSDFSLSISYSWFLFQLVYYDIYEIRFHLSSL